MIVRVFKDPFIQFLIAGALIFGAYRFSESGEQAGAEKRIAIDGPTQQWLYSNFEKQFRRLPSRMEMGALIRVYVENEVKYRESLAMGLDERDTIVRRRMMQKFDFLFGNAAVGAVPEESVLQSWYETHSAEFVLPGTITFTHLWFSPDSRGSAVEADAAAALAGLLKGDPVQGDRFPFDVAFEKATNAEVRNVFGPEFAQSVFEAPVHVWSGPIQSGLGYHVVRVTEKTGSETPPLDKVRGAVLERWREGESDRLLAEMLAGLKAGYAVEIDEESLVRFEYAPDGPAGTR